MRYIDEIIQDVEDNMTCAESDIEFYGECTYKGEEAQRKLNILRQVYELLNQI